MYITYIYICIGVCKIGKHTRPVRCERIKHFFDNANHLLFIPYIDIIRILYIIYGLFYTAACYIIVIARGPKFFIHIGEYTGEYNILSCVRACSHI